VSATEEGIKAILANPMMIKAYQAGIPEHEWMGIWPVFV
jgi:hypothetical protein